MLPKHYNLLVFHLLLLLALISFLVLFLLLTIMWACVLLILLLYSIFLGFVWWLVSYNWHWLWLLQPNYLPRLSLYLLSLHSHCFSYVLLLNLMLRNHRIWRSWMSLCYYGHLHVVQLMVLWLMHHWLHVHLRTLRNSIIGINSYRLYSRIKRWISSHKI